MEYVPVMLHERRRSGSESWSVSEQPDLGVECIVHRSALGLPSSFRLVAYTIGRTIEELFHAFCFLPWEASGGWCFQETRCWLTYVYGQSLSKGKRDLRTKRDADA